MGVTYMRHTPQQQWKPRLLGGVGFSRSMMGFVLNRNDGAFMKHWLSQDEIASVHECLTWGRQPGNNKVLEFFGTVFETYAQATDTLMGRLRSVLPEGSTRCRIRASARETREPKQSTLLDSLGDET